MTTSVKDLFTNVHVRRVPRIEKCSIVDSDVHLGVEVEMENPRTVDGSRYSDTNAVQTLAEAGWSAANDGSLERGIEFVFYDAMLGVDAEEAIRNLERTMRFSPTPRASTHVHVDWSGVKDAESLVALAALLYCFEPAIFSTVMEGRKSNNYCRPLEAVGTINLVPLFTKGARYLQSGYLNGAVGKGDTTYRYFGANFVALSKFGTVEFRYFPAASSGDDIIHWINICLCLRRAALGMAAAKMDFLAALATEQGIHEIAEKFFVDDRARQSLLQNMDTQQAAERMRVMSLLARTDTAEQTPVARGVVSRSVRRLLDSMDLPDAIKKRSAAVRAFRNAVADGGDIADIRDALRGVIAD